ncbi:MAG: glutamate formiminotransferase [Solirubrobacteraceae bacterium]
MTITLLAVPNVSEGQDPATVQQVAQDFQRQPDVRLLDVHSDPDHHRSVYTLAGGPRALSEALVQGAGGAVARIDIRRHQGAHPRIGAIDIAPVVYLREEDVGAACAEALVLADRLGQEVQLPVFLYGALAGGRSRAEVRRGGAETLAERMVAGELTPDFGPRELHPTAGAVLVGVRPPLAAFNVELAPPATLDDAKAVAAAIREGGSHGLPGVRAFGLWLGGPAAAQVSMNVEDTLDVPLARVVAAIAQQATPARAEVVGLVPAAALRGFPADLPVRGARTIEDALAAAHGEPAETD